MTKRVCPVHPNVTLDADGCWRCVDQAAESRYQESEDRVEVLFPDIEDDKR